MKSQGPIQPLPEIAVFDRHHLAMMFPVPIVFAPVGQAVAQAAANVFAGRNERDARGLFQSFQPSHDRK